jgi:aminoglycoside phosphotransferase
MPRGRPTPLTPFEERLVLSLCPRGTRIARAAWFRHHAYPCPIRVDVALPSGSAWAFVVRSIRHPKGHLEREVALYPLLARLGLPVPTLLAGPVRDPSDPAERPRIVLSLLPGSNLQALGERGGRDLARARDLVVDAVFALHDQTHAVRSSAAAHVVPAGGLVHHLETVVEQRGAWRDAPVFREACRRLRPALRAAAVPLVFSNGDYQPANFLAERGRLSGFLDFEFAWFEDPLYGFAKYPIYDLIPLAGVGVVEAFMRRAKFRPRDFAPRVALGCLATLNREIPVVGANAGYRDHVLRLLTDSLRKI